MKILILGVGSPFGDDQLGWLTIDKLSSTKWESISEFSSDGGVNTTPTKNVTTLLKVDLLKVDRPGLNLFKHLAGDYQKIIIIDAIDVDVKIQKIYQLDALDVIQFDGVLSSHGVGVGQALALAQVLGYDISKVVLFALQMQQYEGFVVSQLITKQIEELVIEIIKYVNAVNNEFR